MGNQQITNKTVEKKTKFGSKIVNRLRSKSKKNKSNTTKSEEFIIKLHREQVISGIKDDDVINDQRRVVFISLIGLFQTWRQCPSSILYSAIIMIPFKRKWVYNPVNYKNEIMERNVSHCSIFQETQKIDDFFSLLKWKDSQNLVFWMLDDNDKNGVEHKQNLSVAPFWMNLSQQLNKLYDPVNKSKYDPLILTSQWWKSRHFHSKYIVSSNDVLEELATLTMKFKCIQEILYQSNPSLNPMISYQPKVNSYKITPSLYHLSLPHLSNSSYSNLSNISSNLSNLSCSSLSLTMLMLPNIPSSTNTHLPSSNTSNSSTSISSISPTSAAIKNCDDVDDEVDEEDDGEWCLSFDYDPNDNDDGFDFSDSDI